MKIVNHEVSRGIKEKIAGKSKAGRPSMSDGNKRDAITDAAIALFAAKGFDNTTVDDIALQAGVAKGTVYYHFASKDQLLLELLDGGFQTLAARLEGLTEAESSIEKRLEGIVHEHCNFILDHADLCQVTLAEVVGNSNRRQLLEERLQKHVEFMGQILDASQEYISAQSLELYNISIFGAVSVAMVHFIKHHQVSDWPGLVDELSGLLVQGIPSLLGK